MNDNRELEGYQEDSKADHAIIARHTLLHQGPLPHPAVLKQYNDVVPGAAERIMRMAEQQAIHRQDLEAHIIRTDTLKSLLGMGYVRGTCKNRSQGVIVLKNNRLQQYLSMLITTIFRG